MKPNILFMIADDHRCDAIAAMGDATVRTPHFDSLARDGASSRTMHIQGGKCGAVCIPTRATVLTGRFTHRAVLPHGVDVWPQITMIPPAVTTMPQAFRNAGYRTHLVGKWHNCKASLMASFDGGAEIFLGGMTEHFSSPHLPFDPKGEFPNASAVTTPQHSTERFASGAVDFLDSLKPDDRQPFFLYCAFLSPHDPRTAPREFHEHYPPGQIPLPANFLPRHPFDNGDLVIRDEMLDAFPRTPEIVRKHLSDYYAMIEHQDQQVGRILAALARSGRAENTIVVYTSDHGLAVGSHGLLGKQNVYDHSIRVPFLLRGPGVRAGTKLTGLHQNCDIFPTICDLAQLKKPDTIDGESFAPACASADDPGRPSIYAVYKDFQVTVKERRWKLIRNYQNAQGRGTNRLQLFDMLEDPHETRDLAADPAHALTIKRLLGELAAWQARTEDPLLSA